MCVQCIGAAMTAGAVATGTRSWLVARAGQWLTPRRKRAVTALLIAAGVLGAGLAGPTP
jgi:hypothetical protein